MSFQKVAQGADVAPCAGAWIEITPNKEKLDAYMSLPARERGLKYSARHSGNSALSSLPARERGLKFGLLKYLGCNAESLPARERGLKSSAWRSSRFSRSSLPARERGLKFRIRFLCFGTFGRSLRGSVD